MAALVISSHATQRFRERVDRGASTTEARLCLGRFLASARIRSTPRHWMRADVRPTPGLTFAYCADMPHVCALIREGVVITVITRDLCRATTSRRHLHSVPWAPAPPRRPALRLVDEDLEAA